MPHRAAFAVLLWIGVLTALPGSLPAQVPAERDPTAWPTDGPWDGRRIPPEDWAAASTARRIDPVNDAGWAYGYQWWRIDRRNVEVWADLGYGGQFLAILPAHGVVGLVNSWNLFGDGQSGILGPFLDALIDASRRRDSRTPSAPCIPMPIWSVPSTGSRAIGAERRSTRCWRDRAGRCARRGSSGYAGTAAILRTTAP